VAATPGTYQLTAAGVAEIRAHTFLPFQFQSLAGCGRMECQVQNPLLGSFLYGAGVLYIG
jgi:hypothetical protein